MDETDYPNALPPGYEFEGYRIERVLGQGGFGITYLAYEPALDRKVAIKEFLPGAWAIRAQNGLSVTPLGGEQREAFEWGLMRFVDEAKTLVKFEHPNIVTVFRSFEANGTAYYVMRFVEGKSLDAILGEFGTLSESEIDEIFLPILDGLEAVHKQGIIHRDIKPANIFIRIDGVPVLIDFGAARVVAPGKGAPLTVILTPGYAPHEQYDPEGNQGPWTDIYALGATLYHCVTGERPPIAPTRMSAERYGKPDPLVPTASAAKGQYRPGLLAAIDTALKIGESERPQHAIDLRMLVARTASEGRRPSTTQSVAVARRRWRVAAAIALMMGATGAGVYAWQQADQKSGTQPQEVRSGAEQKRVQEERAEKDRLERERAAEKDAKAVARRLKFEEHIAAARDAIARREWARADAESVEANRLLPNASQISEIRNLQSKARALEAEEKHKAQFEAEIRRPKWDRSQFERGYFRWFSDEASFAEFKFNATGDLIVTRGDLPRATLWDVGSGYPIYHLIGHRTQLTSVAFSQDGTRVATASSNGEVKVWDVETGNEIFQADLKSAIGRLAFSGDGKRILIATSKEIVVLDAQTWVNLFRAESSSGFYNPSISNDGRYVAAIVPNTGTTRVMGDQLPARWLWVKGDGRVWEVDSQTQRLSVAVSNTNEYLAFLSQARNLHLMLGREWGTSRDGAKALKNLAHKMYLVVDTETGKEITRIIPGNQTNDIDFSSDGRFVLTAHQDKTARVWDASSGKEVFRLWHHDRVTRANFSPDGKSIATVSGDSLLRIWDVSSRRERRTIRGIVGGIIRVHVERDDVIVSTGTSDGTVRIWNTSTDREIANVPGYGRRAVDTVIDLRLGRLAISYDDNSGRIWDLSAKREVSKLLGHGDMFWFSAFTADGRRIVTESRDSTVRLWNTDSGEALFGAQVPGSLSYYYEFTIYPGAFALGLKASRLIVLSGQVAHLYDIDTGKKLAVLGGHDEVVVRAMFILSEQKAVTFGAKGTCRIWLATTGKFVAPCRESKGALLVKDGAYQVAPEGSGLSISEVEGGKRIALLQGDIADLFFAIESPPGTHLVTVGTLNTDLWDLKRRRKLVRLYELKPEEADIYVSVDVKFSGDGTLVMTRGSNKKAIQFWLADEAAVFDRVDFDQHFHWGNFAPTKSGVVFWNRDLVEIWHRVR